MRVAVAVLTTVAWAAAACDTDLEGVSTAVKALYCGVETGAYRVDLAGAPAYKAAGCLLGKEKGMCSTPLAVPSELPRSPSPPEAKNKVYQQFAEKAEEAVPRTWWREAFSHDALFLSGRDTQPLVQLKERPMRYKKLRNLYQCATRQVFIRQAFNVSGGATGLYRHAQHVMDSGTGTKGGNKNRGAGRCPAFQNTAVSAFAAKFMDGSTRELLGGTIDAAHGRWRGRSSGRGSAAADGVPGDVDGDGEIDIMEASQMELHQLSAEVLNHFLASPTAGIWQGCFRIQKSPDCRAVLAAACLVEAAHLLPALTAPEAATAFKDPGELVSGYMMASLGRHLLHGATEGTAVARGGLILGLQLADFVVLQQAYLKLYSDSFGALYTSQLATRVPLSFPVMGQEEPFSKAYFPSEALARGKPWPAMYLEGKVTMEPVFSTVRNWMFAEAQNLIDFGPYRPLVANPFVRAALHGSRKRSRRVLIDVGANGFFASPKYLLDSYEPFAAFTDAFMVEPEEHFKAEIPQSYKDRYNITHLQMYAEVNTGTPSDMLALLPSLVSKDDFVVLKFDVDPNRFAQGPTMEWGFLFSLYNNPAVAHLVDELYIELHFHYPQLSWWHLHSNWEALDAIRYLRSKGVVVHAWP